jgi:N-acetylmuramoyl-L-alanine amidase
MKYLYLSKRWITVFWIVMGILLLLAFAAKSREDSLLTVFSSPASNRVIVIDPGHGGIDSGAVSPSGTKEDELNLKVALKLKKYLEDQGASVILTRETQQGLSGQKREDMRKRVEMIKQSNADIVVSIHMNKFPQAQYYGAQTFYMKGSDQGARLAECIQAQMVENLIEGNNRKIKAADNLLILKAGDAPSVIVECGFLSNASEEVLLKTDEYQEKIAWSIYSGILEYFASEETFYWDGANAPSLSVASFDKTVTN